MIEILSLNKGLKHKTLRLIFALIHENKWYLYSFQ
jgi:hypothetical protein